MASTLFGPAESKLLSRNVMPTEPSVPVVTTSPDCTAAPTSAGSFCPARSLCTVPRQTFTWPAACAALEIGRAASRTAATVSDENDERDMWILLSGVAAGSIVGARARPIITQGERGRGHGRGG